MNMLFCVLPVPNSDNGPYVTELRLRNLQWKVAGVTLADGLDGLSIRRTIT